MLRIRRQPNGCDFIECRHRREVAGCGMLMLREFCDEKKGCSQRYLEIAFGNRFRRVSREFTITAPDFSVKGNWPVNFGDWLAA